MHHTTTAAPVTCASCGAALADDQRYCLHCGQAQGDPRVAYRELIAPAVTAAHAAPEPPATTTAAAPLAAPARDWTPVIALGGLAALALVLVVGVLIGKSGTQDAAPPAAPQVITVSAGPSTATTPTETSDTSGSGSGRGGKAKQHSRGGGGEVSAAEQAAGARAVQDLNSASGEDYQRKSARLPDTVALPGRPPAADDKQPGGGSGAETIG